MFRKEHTENDCRYKDFSVCKKCGFSHGKNMIKKKTKKLKLKIKIKIMMKLRIFKIKENNFTLTYSEDFINNKNNNNKLINYNNIIDISSRK